MKQPIIQYSKIHANEIGAIMSRVMQQLDQEVVWAGMLNAEATEEGGVRTMECVEGEFDSYEPVHI